MKKDITEKELSINGFTEKEIARLREILTRPESKNETYCTLLDDLRKRFWGGVVCFCIALVIAIKWAYDFENNDYTYPAIIVFILIAVYKITPIPMAFKAYVFYIKTR